MLELLCQQPVYFHINFWLFVSCSIAVFITCFFPQQRVKISYADGHVTLPPTPLTAHQKFPDTIDQLLTLIFVALITLLYASAQLPKPEVTPAPETTDSETALTAWFDVFFSFFLFSPLIIRYVIVHFGIIRISLKGFLYVVLSLAAIYAFSILINFTGLLQLLIHLTGTPAEQSAVQAIKNTSWSSVMIPMAVSVMIVAPIVEEIFFRGFIFSVLNKRIGLLAAAIMSGILFGAIHFSLAQTVILSFFGIVQCYLYHRTGSIVFPILLHFIFNTLAFIAIIVPIQG